MTVLLFQAIGLPDGCLMVPPAFCTEGQAIPPSEGMADLEIELLDAKGQLLARSRAAFASPCAPLVQAETEAGPPPRLAQAFVTHHADARTLRVSQWGKVMYERSVSGAPPEIKVAWPAPRALAGAEVALGWSCKDPGVHALWQFSADGGQTWMPVSLPQAAAGKVTINLRHLPGGKACRWRLLASDGVHTHRLDSPSFALKPRGWVGMLLAPADGAHFSSGQAIELVGQGFEMESREAEFDQLTWRSSIDGELGAGHRRAVRLSPGEHRIALVVRGRASQTVTVQVE